jgi:cytoplasmic iron level regulating protein YaaA (DUF328/UPF0246 family)
MRKFQVPFWITVWKNGRITRMKKTGEIVEFPTAEEDDGTLMVDLMYSKKYRQYVHRLVAEKYLPNPNNYEHILFKDGNVKNVSVDNLEWCP